MDDTLRIAFHHHTEGRYADAARCYDALLARNPAHADALHLFGVMHQQCGHYARAVELIGQAIALRPNDAAFHANLGEAYRALGQFEQAAESCRAALRLQPQNPEAANNLGLALQALGKNVEAVEQFRTALRLRPSFALAQNNLGTILGELGQKTAALEAFRAAVALDPKLAMARANLGQLLVDQGRLDEGLPHCQEAVRLQPDLAAAHNNLGNAFRALERWSEADAAYAEALRLAPDVARVHANRGLALQQQNKPALAVPCLLRAVELAPEDFEMRRLLANAHVANEDYSAALSCLEQNVALRPDDAQGYNDLGWALQEEGRLDEAADRYRRALELQPNHMAALLNQGGLYEELGETAQAEVCFHRAISAHPAAPEPLARLATLLRGKLPDGVREAARLMLDDSSLTDGQRGALLFGSAQVHDADEMYAEAAACLSEANALTLKQRRKDGRPYDRSEHSLLVDRLIAGFTPELFHRLAGAGDNTRQPVFVFGMPRSGTTLVEQVLASHSRVYGAGELRLARQTFEAVPAVVGLPDEMLACLKALDAAGVQKLSRRHRDGLQAILPRDRAPTPERIVDKMPDNYLYLGLLALLFPRATLVHVRRDPRDVAVSCWMTNFRSIRWANDPVDLAERIREHQRLTAHWQAVLPVKPYEIVYEKLVDNFETEARRLVEACGLEWEPACLQFHETKRAVRTASVNQVRQPLYRRALARWKHYETALAELFTRLASP